MKFLERLFGRSKKEEPAKYTPDELISLLKEDFEQENKDAYSEASPILEDIYESFECLRTLALEIKDAECSVDVNPRIINVLRTAKPEFVREFTEAVKKRDGVAGLEEEKTAISETMDLLAKAVMGPGKYVAAAYGEDFESIRKELKNLAVKKKELEAISCVDADPGGVITEIEHLIALSERRSSAEKGLGEASKKREALEKEGEVLVREKESIEQGDEYLEFLRKKDALKEALSEKEETENQVYNLITPLRRPLKMLRKSLEENGDKGSPVKELERYADDPVTHFVSGDPQDLKDLLSALKKNLEINADIKPDEKKRINHKIEMIEEHDLDGIRKDLASLAGEIDKLSHDIDSSKLEKKKEDLEKELVRIRRDISSADEDLSRLSKMMARDAAELETKRSELENKAGRIINKKVCLMLAR